MKRIVQIQPWGYWWFFIQSLPLFSPRALLVELHPPREVRAVGVSAATSVPPAQRRVWLLHGKNIEQKPYTPRRGFFAARIIEVDVTPTESGCIVK